MRKIRDLLIPYENNRKQSDHDITYKYMINEQASITGVPENLINTWLPCSPEYLINTWI